MITFCISLALLVIAYFTYGKLCERIFGVDENRKTPAIEKADGVDYIVMPKCKIFLIHSIVSFHSYSSEKFRY